jgi:replication factor C large subunit
MWRYAGFLMTGGVQAAKEKRRHGYIAFRPPGLWRRLGQSKKARNIRDSAAKKIAGRVHLSSAYVRAELMGFIGLLLKDKRLAPKVAAELDLNPEEIALLTGSTPTTKKVQAVYEEALRIREAEAVEEIELAWGGSPQRSLQRTSDEIAEQRPAGKAEAEAKADSPEAISPTGGPLVENPLAKGNTSPKADVPKKGRGRPRKAKPEEDTKVDSKVDKKPEPLSAQTGKRQRSLFDF